MKKRNLIYIFIFLVFILFLLNLIINIEKEYLEITRYERIPFDAVKVTPETDLNPPKSLSNEYEQPIPLSSIINTAGAEDSPFITPDGNTLYFFFTPDVRIPVEKQLLDDVTGIWVSHKINNHWSEPKRVWLQKPGKLALDGCPFINKNVMQFCSAREGYEGVHWFSAEYKDNKWTNIKEINFPKNYEVGELHEHDNQIYYHSNKIGGKGGLDIWMIEKNIDETWTEPRNIEAVNSETNEGFPALSPDGKELWFSKDYAIWRSKKVANKWTEPEKMFSPLAGEPSVDSYGNVYFVHHFFKEDKMIEADIYVAYKK